MTADARRSGHHVVAMMRPAVPDWGICEKPTRAGPVLVREFSGTGL
jgi:hypothetical protein